jgi:type IX secretion system PorP/SprF family membrane protein
MRKFLLSLILIGAGLAGRAQQKPQYTQYVLNNILLNPAVSGIENYIDVKAGHRSQWSGLYGAPVTTYLTLNAPLGPAFVGGDAAALSPGNENPYSSAYAQSYRAAEPHQGIGFTLVSDQAGPFSTTDINLTYAYHLGLSSTLNLAVGAAAGFDNTVFNTSGLILTDPDDLAISNAGGSRWKPDLGAGAWAYSSVFYAGLSARQTFPASLYREQVGQTGKPGPGGTNWFLTSGFKLFLSDDVTLVPSALLKLVRPLPPALDVTMKLAFRDRFWVGGAYRHRDALAGLLGLNISSLVNIGYAYDHSTSALGAVNSGTHEIVLGFMLNNRSRVICPKHTF